MMSSFLVFTTSWFVSRLCTKDSTFILKYHIKYNKNAIIFELFFISLIITTLESTKSLVTLRSLEAFCFFARKVGGGGFRSW